MSTPTINSPDHIPVTGLVAFTQTALGFGAGLLLAGKMPRSAQKATALAMLSIGVISTLPLVFDLVSKRVNRPGSKRSMRKRLASIRRDAGVSSEEMNVF